MTPPEPMSAPDCDLRGYEYMPLFGSRLFGSRLYSKALRNPRAGLAALKLWWISWQQCPAGSLPDDDDDLSMLADFGADVKGWLKVRDLALHGFVKCSDGRLYHPLICEEAKVAFERRRKERDRKAKMRAAKAEKSEDGTGNSNAGPEDVPRDKPGTDLGSEAGRDADVRSERRGEDSTEERKKESFATLTAAQAPPVEVSARSRLWGEGVASVVFLTGKRQDQCRQLVGKWLKSLGDNCAVLNEIIADCRQEPPISPVDWISAAVNRHAPGAVGAPIQPPLRQSRMQRIVADYGLAREHDDIFQAPIRELLN